MADQVYITSAPAQGDRFLALACVDCDRIAVLHVEGKDHKRIVVDIVNFRIFYGADGVDRDRYARLQVAGVYYRFFHAGDDLAERYRLFYIEREFKQRFDTVEFLYD